MKRNYLFLLIAGMIFLPGCLILQAFPDARATLPAAFPAATETTVSIPATTGATTATASAATASAASTLPVPAILTLTPPTSNDQIYVPMTNPGAPEVASYVINVRLDPGARQLTGKQVLTYHNTTQKAFSEIIFHLYLNAFENKDTLFMKESGGQLRGFAFDPQHNGWIQVTSIQIQDGQALTLELLEDGTLARARLPHPVEPGQSIQVQMAFEAQLPQIFARTGWALDAQQQPFFLVGQWFPKAGVWTNQGWSADPFHGNAEFFADFGSYQISMTVPQNYVIGATGLLADIKQHPDGFKTVTYQAAGVIDFAWVASVNLKSVTRQVGDGELLYLYLPEHEFSIRQVLDSAQASLSTFSDWFGPYPYPRLTLVDVPDSGSGAGGMEYPMFVTLGAEGQSVANQPQPGWGNFLQIVTAHEIAHQWWQSTVATNEGREPWLDEGFADYSTIRLFIQDYGLPFESPQRLEFASRFLQGRRSAFLSNPDLPMDAAAWKYSFRDYVIAAYAKPDMALMTLEAQLGEKTMLEIFRRYYQRYQFAHPTTQDFQQVAVQVSGQPLDWFFDGLVYGNDTLDYEVTSLHQNSVTVERQGAIQLPADVLVSFADGGEQTVTCEAVKPNCTYTFAKPVKSVVVDPQRKLWIDLNWIDNLPPAQRTPTP